MINQVSNNKPSGFQSIDCDAGVPIMGRTASDGSYQIFKVNSDGSLPFASSLADTGTAYALSPANIPSVLGAFAGGVLIDYIDVITTSIDAGAYTISPFYGLNASTSGGAVSIALIKVGSNMDSYTSGLIVGTDAFSPPITIAFGGIAQFWHNLALNPYGSLAGISIATGTNNTILEKTQYLEAGTYKIAVICHTAFTKGNPVSTAGLYMAVK